MFTELYQTNNHESAPVKKSNSGMISFQREKNEEFLVVVGGEYEESPRYKQRGAQYHRIFGGFVTNESHIFNITTSEYIILSNIIFSIFV